MKTANVKWGEENERQLATKVNAKEEFVRPTWIDLDFSSPATAREIFLMSVVYPSQRRHIYFCYCKKIPSNGAKNSCVDGTRNSSAAATP